MKFEFDVLGNQSFYCRSANGKDDDFRVLITWQPDPKKAPQVILIKLSSREHFQVWIDQLLRIKSYIKRTREGLQNPTAVNNSFLGTQSRLLMAHSTKRLSSASLRESYASSHKMTDSQSSLTTGLEYLQMVSFSKVPLKPVFDYDVGILYNKESLPLAMTLLDLVQKEGHKASVDISAERWAGFPNLNDSGKK